ncbi:MAG: hypothetical protein A3I66_01370 [Burkholderiales bacterium RIFCSPLOWO2_02_FULL_57_36]|nr:MAG: hypothetical protein A3I66_01370 [Burkholderiales bacterium RIFCSPLOWO2_02_FULL_57_36]
MSVQNPHIDYAAMAGKWKRCRDVAAGQDAVHAAQEEYLPKLKEQTPTDYEAYVTRAIFYNATWRTIAGLLGMLYRKPPTIDVPESVKPLLEDVTMNGVPFHVFSQKVAEESLSVGRVGVLVDYPMASPEMTLADAAELNLRPTMCMYKSESIINWRTRRVNNKTVLCLVVLAFKYVEQVDEFEEKSENRFRVLDLDPTTGDTYRMRVFTVDDKGNNILLETSVPLMGSKPLDFIPFTFIGVDDITPDVDEPPLIDLVDLNLSHYRTTADYEHGCHFTGLPTAVVSGYSPKTDDEGRPIEKLYIGSQSAWVFTDPNAKASFLEFTGQGLGALERNLDRKEAQMAILGARMLEGQKKAAEAAETAGIHRSGENSVLSSAAQTLSIGLKKSLETFCLWGGANAEVTFELNRDFFPMPMDYRMLKELVNALQKGGISFETFFENLKKGEVISSTITMEEEQTRIKMGPGPVPAT